MGTGQQHRVHQLLYRVPRGGADRDVCGEQDRACRAGQGARRRAGARWHPRELRCAWYGVILPCSLRFD